MERMEMLKRQNTGLANISRMMEHFFNVKEEDIDMRRYISKFKERDFKLRRLFNVVSGGWSFSNMYVFVKDGNSIF